MKDYFKGVTEIIEIYETKIVIEDIIPNEIPKYAKDRWGMGIPNSENEMDDYMLGFQKEFVLKEAFNKAGMYGFVSWKWIDPFVKWIGGGRCLEIMAGRGWLSWALQQKGVNVKATDDFSWAEKFSWKEPLIEVEKLDAAASIKKYGKDIDILIISWPYMDNSAYQAIKELYTVNPDTKIIYIGEGWGGCTADDDFHAHFEMIEDDEFNQNVSSNYDTWTMLHDAIYLGRYKK